MMSFSKGAPDVLPTRCAYDQAGLSREARPLKAERRAEILTDVERLAAEALRTIGVALRTMPRKQIDEAGELGEHMEQEFTWLGVIGMIDPPPPGAAESGRLTQQAGVKVIMITGDHPVTAGAMACALFTNKWVWLAILLSLLLQVAVVYLPLLEIAFRTVSLNITD
jgi:P-type Ca2+ transporter type 2C